METNDADDLARHLRQDALVYAVVLSSELDEVPADALEGMTVAAEARLSRRDFWLVAESTGERLSASSAPQAPHPGFC